MEKERIVNQTKLAFDLIQKLYLETSYFIKEIEGILQQEDEEFQILRPSGYQITTFRSVGLESGVTDWFTKKGVVFFVTKSDYAYSRGQTITKITPNLKIILVRFVLNDKELSEPGVWAGVLSNFSLKTEITKFEYLTWKFAYHDKKLLRTTGESSYEDGEVSFKLNLINKPLYDMATADDINKEIIKPILKIYRQS